MSSSSSYPAIAADGPLHKIDPIGIQYLRLSMQCNGALKVGIMLRMGQHIKMDQLKTALIAMEARHPNTRCVVKDSKTLQEIIPSSDRVEPVTTVSEHWEAKGVGLDEGKERDTWKKVWAKLSTTPARIGASGLSAALVNGTDLVITCDHYMCDGISFLEFSHELVQAIADPTLKWEARPMLPGMTAMIRRTISSRFRRTLTVLGVVGGLIADETYNKYSRWPKSPTADPSTFENECLMSSFNLSADDTKVLAAFAKSEYGSSLNSVATVALMHAFSQAIDHKKSIVQLVLTVNGRTRYKTKNTKKGKQTDEVDMRSCDLAAHATAINLRYTFRRNKKTEPEEIWAGVTKTHNEIHNSMKNPSKTFGQMMVASTLSKMLPMDEQGPSVFLSNWGRTPFSEDYGGDVGAIEQVTPLMNQVLFSSPYALVSTTNGKFDVNIIGTPRHFSQHDINRLSSEVEQILKNMIKHARDVSVGNVDEHSSSTRKKTVKTDVNM